MNTTKSILVILLITTTLRASGQTDSCRRIIGKSEYSLADYSNIGWSKEMQDTLLVLKTQFKHCFCNNTDKIFLKSLETKRDAVIMIEPKIINLKSCDGLYSYRVFSKKSKLSVRFLNGIWHEVFLVSNSKVYYLNDLYRKDSLAVDRLIDNLTPELLKLFSDEDIEDIRAYGNRWTYWTDNSIEIPLIIYFDKGAIYFDNRRKE